MPTLPDRTFQPVVFGRRLALSIAGLTVLAISANSLGQDPSGSNTNPPPVATGNSGGHTHSYDIHVLRDDASFAQPVNQWTYYFKIAPGAKLTGSAYFDLDTEWSPTIRPGEGTISVLLNDKPVASRKIGDAKNHHATWHIDLPLRLFNEGFNNIRLISRQVSVDGPCKDVDFSSNWVRLTKSSVLHIERADPNAYPLYSFPFPFLDPLSDNPVQSTWILPDDLKPSVVGEALAMASDWGRYEQSRGLSFNLTRGNNNRPGASILFGATSGWNSSQTQNLGPDQGVVAITPGGPAGNARLSLAGATEAGLTNARKALAFPEMVAQMRGSSSVVTSPPPQSVSKPTTKVGTFTFADLGLPSIRLAGAYKQSTTLTIQRPVRCDLGRDSYISLHFRHSANLNPLRSSLNMTINGVPFSSIRLDGDNANEGTVKARIPVNELAKNLWQIEIMSYHDLASIDCSKSYDDVAFTIIEGDSSFELSAGSLGGRPFLDAFPYLVGRDGLAPQRCSISLPNSPSNAALSAAASIAARAAQMNRSSFDWDVNFGGLPQSQASSISIGYFNDTQRLAPIMDKLLVAPQQGGGFKIDPRLRLLQSSLNGAAVLQAVRSPWTDAGVLYVLLGSDDAAITRFVKLLGDPNKAAKLTGEVAVLTSDEQLITLSSVQDVDARNTLTTEMNRYTPWQTAIGIGLVLILGIIVIFVAKQFIKKTPHVG